MRTEEDKEARVSWSPSDAIRKAGVEGRWEPVPHSTPALSPSACSQAQKVALPARCLCTLNDPQLSLLSASGRVSGPPDPAVAFCVEKPDLKASPGVQHPTAPMAMPVIMVCSWL